VKPKQLCIYCHNRPATVPDRNAPSVRFVRKVCTECHGALLRGDLDNILRIERERRALDAKETE